jgi:hypothetical protein
MSEDNAFKLYDQEWYGGKETAWSKVADFMIDPGENVQSRKATHFDQGNPGQCMVGRAGPDGVDPTNGFVRPVNPGLNHNLGRYDFCAYDEDAGTFLRCAMVYARYKGPAKASLHLSTPGGELIVTEDGRLDVTGMVGGADYVQVVKDGRRGRIRIEWE